MHEIQMWSDRTLQPPGLELKALQTILADVTGVCLLPREQAWVVCSSSSGHQLVPQPASVLQALIYAEDVCMLSCRLLL